MNKLHDYQRLVDICVTIGYVDNFILGNPEGDYIQLGDSGEYSVYSDITDIIYNTDFINKFMDYVGICRTDTNSFYKELLYSPNHIIFLESYIERTTIENYINSLLGELCRSRYGREAGIIKKYINDNGKKHLINKYSLDIFVPNLIKDLDNYLIIKIK